MSEIKVIVNLPEFRSEVTDQADTKIDAIGVDFRTTFYRQYGAKKSGRLYRRPKPLSGTYRASAPGEPPAIASGNLFRMTRLTFPDRLTAQITLDTPYAALLEYGTARMQPRPYVGPSIKSIVAQYKGGVRRPFQ